MSVTGSSCATRRAGDSGAAVSGLQCAHCSRPLSEQDAAAIDVYLDGTMFVARSNRGRAALMVLADGIDELSVDAGRLDAYIEWLNGMGLSCARPDQL